MINHWKKVFFPVPSKDEAKETKNRVACIQGGVRKTLPQIEEQEKTLPAPSVVKFCALPLVLGWLSGRTTSFLC